MARRIDTALGIEGYVRASVYHEERLRDAVREYKPAPEPIHPKEALVWVRREELEEIIKRGSPREIAGILIRGRLEPSELCNYRTSAECGRIPHEVQLALAKKFVEIAGKEEKNKDNAPNRTGLALLAATAAGTVGGALEDFGFIGGVAAALAAACCLWKAKSIKLSESRELARAVLESERLTSRDAREAFLDYLEFAKPENQ
jgi:hypothetical protein